MRALVAVLHFRRVLLLIAAVRIIRVTVPISPIMPPHPRCFSLHNPFDVLGDMDFLPEEIVDELMCGADGSVRGRSGVKGKHLLVHPLRFPYLRTLLELQSPPEL